MARVVNFKTKIGLSKTEKKRSGNYATFVLGQFSVTKIGLTQDGTSQPSIPNEDNIPCLGQCLSPAHSLSTTARDVYSTSWSICSPNWARPGSIFSPHFLFSFSVLHAHSDTSYGLKLVHSASKALTKP